MYRSCGELNNTYEMRLRVLIRGFSHALAQLCAHSELVGMCGCGCWVWNGANIVGLRVVGGQLTFQSPSYYFERRWLRGEWT